MKSYDPGSDCQRSPAWDLLPKELITCVQENLGLSYQGIADRLGVNQSTVNRWYTQEIEPRKEHRRGLVQLHDSKTCRHSLFVYVCDHPVADVMGEAYRDPPLTELVPESELLSICVDSQAGSNGHIKKMIITAEADLPRSIRSRCYRLIREGHPTFLVLHRHGDEAAAVGEFRDHIVENATSHAPLAVYDSTQTILPTASVDGAHHSPRAPLVVGDRLDGAEPTLEIGAAVTSFIAQGSVKDGDDVEVLLNGTMKNGEFVVAGLRLVARDKPRQA
jgi:hypothetical protein